eukprot:PhF_6_TR17090/c0_g1_i1/m.26263/K05643/ABCA3; ATP-binding cassette, subfamily A (ABC1), member 3
MEPAPKIKPSRLTHIGLCLKKNWWMKKRRPCATILEMFLPVFLLLALVAGWSLAKNTNNPDAEYWNDSYIDIDAMWLTNASMICYNDTQPGPFRTMKLCPAGMLDYMFCEMKVCLRNLPSYEMYMPTEPTTIPSLDAFVLLYKAFQSPKKESPKKALIFTPASHPSVQKISQYMSINYNGSKLVTSFPQSFETEASAIDCAKGDCAGKFWAVIDMSRFNPDQNQYDYTIRMNMSDVPGTYTIQDFFVSGGLGSAKFERYLASGFVVLQRFMNEYIHSIKNPEVVKPKAVTVVFPTGAYIDYTFLSRAGALIPTVIVFAYLYFVSMLTKSIVEEKELRIREGMLIMGLDKTSLYLSWLLTYAILMFLSSLAVTLIIVGTFFNHTSFLLVFMFVYLFSMSLVGWSFLLSTFFSKAKIAATVAPLTIVGTSIPIALLPSDSPDSTFVGVSYPFSCNTFQLVFNLFGNYETAGMGANFNNWNSDDISLSTLFWVFWVNIIIYFGLALYCDNVLPSEYGVPLHPLFFLKKEFWTGYTGSGKKRRKRRDTEGPESRSSSFFMDPSAFRNIAEGSSLIEEITTKEDPSVQLVNLRKTFPSTEKSGGDFVAVDDLNLAFFEGQITVLLGHNGAGKTTTINMLTGMLPPTDGDCSIYGKSIRKFMPEIRQDLGFCPQHNILWKGVTCTEHLVFFAGLKGVPREQIDTVVHNMLVNVDLVEKKDAFANVLSGGQKRKLSVAIALIGGSRLVFLDEPTAGMDVQARHHMWDILRKSAPGRTIVLTTHYMDEADLLGQSIAIMHKGKLNCWGSPMFLKSKLGVGYNLALAVNAAKTDGPAIEKIITRYVSEARNVSKAAGEIQYCLPMNSVNNFPTLFAALEAEGAPCGVTSFGISITTMEEIFLRIAMQEADVADENEEEERVNSMLGMRAANRNSRLEIPLTGEMGHDDYSVPPDQRSKGMGLLLRQFRGLFMKRVHVGRRDRRAQCCNIVLPVVTLALAMLVKNLGPPAQPRLVLGSNMYDIAANGPLSFPFANCSDVPGLHIDSTYHRVPWGNLSASSTDDKLINTTYKHGDYQRFIAMTCNASVSSDPNTFFTTLWHNATSWHALPEIVQNFENMFFTDVFPQVANHPLPFTNRQQNTISSIQSMIIALFVLIPFCLIPANYVAFLVKEREVKAKHVQLVSGVNVVAYWCSSYLFDMLTYMITASLALLVFTVFDRTEYVGDAETTSATTVLLFLFGLSSTGLVYMTNFFFINHSTAQNITMMGNIVCGFFLVLAAFILDLIDSTKDTNKKLKYIYRLVPSYCLGEGIMNLASRPLLKAFGQSEGPFDLNCTGNAMVYMGIEAPIFFLVTLIIDAPWWQSLRAKAEKDVPDATKEEEEDCDVTAESAEVTASEKGREGDLVTVQHIRKVFPPAGNLNSYKVAVKDISFGVKRAEIFGFLGTNGAGKTTTMSILSGEFPPTRGAGYIFGHNVVTDLGNAQQHLGYCPQFDALLDLMTPEEHMFMYARLRGVPEDRIDHCMKSLFTKLDLHPHARKQSKDLSGGNKRKLSIAIAMIGGPPVLFLDEPSAGMDPVARRGLWNALQEFSVGRSVILTTHHLEEVEALCHRVAIMVDGALRCIGTLQHLKNKFGTGYDLDVKAISEAHVESCKKYVLSICSTAVLEEVQGTKLSYKLPRDDVKLSTVFAAMQSATGEGKDVGIRDFAVSQTSLESVFMKLSQKCFEGENEVATQRLQAKETEAIGK